MNNLPALKSSYQAASEIHRQIVESENLRPSAEKKFNDLTAVVEGTRQNYEATSSGVFASPETSARQCAIKSCLDKAIADQGEAAKELALLLGTISRLRINAENVKAELVPQTDEAISGITSGHDTSIKGDERLRQMLLEIHSARALSVHVNTQGIRGFSVQDILISPFSNSTLSD